MESRHSSIGRALAALRRRLATTLLRLVLARRRQTRSDPGPEHMAHVDSPRGPFRVAHKTSAGTLLLFVPRNLQGRLIDEMTGRYGYSHLAIDCGEVDLATGKRVMVEATLRKVHRSFQDEYGSRGLVRLPLAAVGVDGQAFSACVLSKIGEAYDYLEAFTRGALDDPARQTCSDLATVCLPATLCEEIARRATLGLLRRSAVSVHEWSGGRLGLFVSPNGFAEFLGAPPAFKLAARRRSRHRP
jgi:hypothetical protein